MFRAQEERGEGGQSLSTETGLDDRFLVLFYLFHFILFRPMSAKN